MVTAAVVAVVYVVRHEFRDGSRDPVSSSKRELVTLAKNLSYIYEFSADPGKEGSGFVAQDACTGCCVACPACSSYCVCDSCTSTTCSASQCSGGDSSSGSGGGCWEFPDGETCSDGDSDQVHPFKTGPCIEILNLDTGKSTCFEDDHLVKMNSKWMLAREIKSDAHFKVIGERTSTRLSACWFGGAFQGDVNGFRVATYPLISPEMVRATVPTWLIKAFNAIFHYY